jgi:prepilin-type N-terminal cleavage/methylation domain-containing protein
VIFYNCHRTTRRSSARGFTLVESVVAITLIGIGVVSTLGALTKFNSIAATSRNATGASAVLINQIDLFQSMSPFNPQKTSSGVDLCGGATPPPQIPKDYCNTPPTYDMTVGTHTLAYKDPTTGLVSTQTDPWPVYREPSRWTYTDAGSRTSASGFVNTDIGQLAYQSDDKTFWRLQSTAPTWTQDLTGGMIVTGTMTVIVTDISTTAMPNTYQAVFTLTYKYLNHDGLSHNGITLPPYSLSMSAIRTSDI